MQSKGFFVSVEGIEGMGKSTAVRFIADFLQRHNQSFVLTREPGGTKIAEQIRQVLLTTDTNEKIMPETELLLMFACRVQHLAHVVSESLREGHWVVCDRFVDASFAYQGGGRKIDLKLIQMLDNWLVKRHPDVTILLDGPVELGMERTKYRGLAQDRIELEEIEFFKRVREVYLQRAKAEPKRFYVIDASQSLEVVEQNISKILEKYL